MGYVVGRTKAETFGRDLRVLHTALELINECLRHSRFLRDALITDCDVPSPDIPLSGAYDAISSVGCAVPLRFVIAHLPMLLSVAAEKLMGHTEESVDSEKVTYFLSKGVKSRYIHRMDF